MGWPKQHNLQGSLHFNTVRREGCGDLGACVLKTFNLATPELRLELRLRSKLCKEDAQLVRRDKVGMSPV